MADCGIPKKKEVNEELLSVGGDHLVSPATATTNDYDESNDEDGGERKRAPAAEVDLALREFHHGRALHVKFVPPEATEQDLKDALKEMAVEIKEIQLNERTHTAKVILEEPEALDSWKSERTLTLLDQPVKVTPSPTENVLCIAHLPLIYSEDDFRNLVQMYGPISRCFLMKSEVTGHSKGYGFVEYTTKEVANQAKTLLDWKTIENCTLHCDWLDSSYISYESLHSKCLFIDHLPSDFRDVNELRKIFSIVVKPLYCQVVLKNREPMGIGLVEFGSHQDAEETQQKLNGYQMEKAKIRVTFCIPGMHAITVFNKLTSEGGPYGKKPLLPDPVVNPALLNQLQVLAMQNPQFFQNLQNLVSAQLQNLQNNNQVQNTYQNKKSSGSSGLLGSPPSLNSNPNVQAAALLLLATQTQMRLQQPSLLGNPFLVSQLQNLIKRNNRLGSCTNPLALNGSLQALLNQLGVNAPAPPAAGGSVSLSPKAAKTFPGPEQQLASNFNDPPGMNCTPLLRDGPNDKDQGYFKNNGHKTALLPNPNGFAPSKALLPTPVDSFTNHNAWSSPPGRHNLPSWEAQSFMTKSDFAPLNGNRAGSNGNLPEKNPTHMKTPLLGDKPKSMNGFPTRLPLLGDKPSSLSRPSLSPPNSNGNDLYNDGRSNFFSPPPLNGNSKPSNEYNGYLNSQSPYRSGNRSPQSSNGLLPSPDSNGPYSSNSLSHTIDAAHLSQLNSQLEKLGNNPLINLLLQAAQSNSTSHLERGEDSSNDVNNVRKNFNSMHSSPEGSYLGHGNLNVQNRPYSPISSKPSLLGMPPPQLPLDRSDMKCMTKKSLLGDYPGDLSNNGTPYSRKPPMHASPLLGKRKYHSLLPSPEESPESGYVGQHSQGLGGHYADSYYKRLRK